MTDAARTTPTFPTDAEIVEAFAHLNEDSHTDHWVFALEVYRRIVQTTSPSSSLRRVFPQLTGIPLHQLSEWTVEVVDELLDMLKSADSIWNATELVVRDRADMDEEDAIEWLQNDPHAARRMIREMYRTAPLHREELDVSAGRQVASELRYELETEQVRKVVRAVNYLRYLDLYSDAFDREAERAEA